MALLCHPEIYLQYGGTATSWGFIAWYAWMWQDAAGDRDCCGDTFCLTIVDVLSARTKFAGLPVRAKGDRIEDTL
jgi:hypothetical protein